MMHPERFPDVSSRHFISLVGLAIIITWGIINHFFLGTYFQYPNVFLTAITFASLGVVSIALICPQISPPMKLYLMFWLVVKIAFGVIYFENIFLNLDGNWVTILEYGDSYIYHSAALDYLDTWNQGTIPTYGGSRVAQWGYGYFLALLYFISGPLPLNGIIFNSFLAFLTCLASYRLFIEAGLSETDAQVGTILLSISPILWLVSSYLYKDSFLFLSTIVCAICVIRMLREFQIKWLLATLVLLGVLGTLRFPYAFVLFGMMLYGVVLDHKRRWDMKIARVFVLAVVSIVLVITADRFGLVLIGTQDALIGFTDFVKYININLDIHPLGGRFLTEGIGSNVSWLNFIYVLPARAVYILTIPFPWFGGEILPEKIDYLGNHLESLYYIAILTLSVLAYFNQKKVMISTNQRVLIMTGITLFALPLLMHQLGKRYILMAIPFFLAYSLPYLIRVKPIMFCVGSAVGLITIVQIAYYLR